MDKFQRQRQVVERFRSFGLELGDLVFSDPGLEERLAQILEQSLTVCRLDKGSVKG